jgi:hypothetical protein
VTRGDVELAVSLGLPYPVVAEFDDRIKTTYWVVLEAAADKQRGGGGG